MGKIFQLIATSTLLLMLAGCGGGGGGSDDDDNGGGATPSITDCILGSSEIGSCKIK